MKFMTEKFRVYSIPKIPLTQVPPAAGFITAMPASARVNLLTNRGQPVGFLSPIVTGTAAKDEDIAVCRVTESHARPSSSFPNPSVQSFLCEVTFGVEVSGFEGEAVVRGPRLVEIGEAFVDKEDGRRTVGVEIIEMFLSGYDSRGSLITVKGGKNLGLPTLPGEIKSLTKKSDFPAEINFDLELEVTDWATEFT